MQPSAAPVEAEGAEVTVETSVMPEERAEIGVAVEVEAQEVQEVMRVERAGLEARADA
jgi:hypothetical protein